MPPDQSDRFVKLPQQWQQDDEETLQALVPLAHKEMRRRPHRHLQSESRITPCRAPLCFAKLTFNYLEASGWICRTGFIAVGSRLLRQMQGLA